MLSCLYVVKYTLLQLGHSFLITLYFRFRIIMAVSTMQLCRAPKRRATIDSLKLPAIAPTRQSYGHLYTAQRRYRHDTDIS